jgi:16S rRNA G527 N7-methylase RsmG
LRPTITSGSVTDAELSERLESGLADLKLVLQPAHVERLIRYLRLIERWNGT